MNELTLYTILQVYPNIDLEINISKCEIWWQNVYNYISIFFLVRVIILLYNEFITRYLNWFFKFINNHIDIKVKDFFKL